MVKWVSAPPDLGQGAAGGTRKVMCSASAIIFLGISGTVVENTITTE